MLYVLTASDTEAVSPGNLTAWKESLLHELYLRAARELAGETSPADETVRAGELRGSLCAALRAEFPEEWLAEQLGRCPVRYLLHTAAPQIAAHLRVVRDFDGSGARVDSEYVESTGLCQYTVYARDDLTPGIFFKIAGVLAAERFSVLSADIITRTDGIVIDTFGGMDLDFSGEPPLSRRQEIGRRIAGVLGGADSLDPQIVQPQPAAGSSMPVEPPKVELDNNSSDHYTIIDVFAQDHQGLLHLITRTLFELNLSVNSARISTHLDQIVDVFFVTTSDGRKITEPPQLDLIRRRLQAVLEEIERPV
jgi:[protein-PII] uridylyltransferase